MMAQLTIEEISKSRQGEVIHLELLVNGRRLVRDVTASKVDASEKLAYWLVSQIVQGSGGTSELPRRRLVVDYHLDDGPVIDGVAVSRLVEDQAILDIDNLPGWAGYTGDEAENWIEVNVTSLATAKTAMKAMARMIVAERDVIKKLVERIGK